MTDEAKLGMVAGLLAVVGVAVFNVPKEPPKDAKPLAVAGTPATPPSLPPAAVAPAKE